MSNSTEKMSTGYDNMEVIVNLNERGRGLIKAGWALVKVVEKNKKYITLLKSKNIWL